MSNASSPPTEDIAARDSTLDSGRTGDESYLQQLGYRQELNRILGLFGSFAIMFSTIAVSIGLYTLYGYGLATSGPFMIVPFIVGALLQMIVGMGIAELVSCYPVAGGSYQIASRVGPKNIGWMVGWILGISLMAATAAEAVAIAPYVLSWIGVDHPDQFQTLAVAFSSIILITLINVVGIRLSSTINNIGVLAELFGLTTVLVLLLAAGIVQPISFFSNDNGTAANYGGSLLIPFAFTLMMPVWIINAFDSPGHTGEETHKAAVTAPRAIMIANWSSFAYGVIAVVVLTLSISNLSDVTSSSAPIVAIVTDRLGDTIASALTVVVIVSFIVNMQILQLTVARMFWAQARDGQLPFSHVLRKISNHSPANATIGVAVIALALTLWTDAVAVLAAFSALGYAFVYGWTSAVGWWANRKGGLPKHPFSFGRWTQPILAVAAIWSLVFAVIQIYQNPNQIGLGAVVVVILGLLIYYVGVPATRRGVITQAGVEAVAAEPQV